MWLENLYLINMQALLEMPTEADFAALLASLIVLGILGGSGILWIQRLRCSKQCRSQIDHAPAWPIGWINFGIFICALIVGVVAVQLCAAQLLEIPRPVSNDPALNHSVETSVSVPAPVNQEDLPNAESSAPELTPWLAVLGVVLLQVPLFTTFYGLRKFYPNSFAGRLSTQSVSVRQAVMQVVPAFIRYLPMIWIVSFTWSGFLNILQRFNLIEAFPPQELIQIFHRGGSPAAITALVICAIVLAPIVEEIIFRGGIYSFLKSQATPVWAQLISATLFALMHGNLLSFLPLMLIGMLLARIYERSGNIVVPICFHACFNGFNLLILCIMHYASIPIS